MCLRKKYFQILETSEKYSLLQKTLLSLYDGNSYHCLTVLIIEFLITVIRPRCGRDLVQIKNGQIRVDAFRIDINYFLYQW